MPNLIRSTRQPYRSRETKTRRSPQTAQRDCEDRSEGGSASSADESSAEDSTDRATAATAQRLPTVSQQGEGNTEQDTAATVGCRW